MSTVIDKPLIVVAGSTGGQGGSVVRYLLKDGGFRVRGITRNKNSEKAKELSARGVEVVEADLNDIGTLTKAFEGAYGVFGVTNYWDPNVLNAEKEIAHGKALVDAAKAAGVKHFVWSTLPHTPEPIVEHANSKAAVDDYLKASGVPRTSLYTVFFYENFTNSFKVIKAEDGSLEANWPLLVSDNKIGCYPSSDTGAWVLASFKSPKEWIGKDIKVIVDLISPREIIKTLSAISGKNIKLVEINNEAFENTKNIPKMYEMYTNMKFFYNNDGNPGYDFALTKKLYPSTPNFEDWARAHINELIQA